MKTQVHLPIFCAWLLAVTISPLRAQLVGDGATNTLNNVSTNFAGDVTVGTNGSFTLLVLADNALLTNSVNGIIGRNSTAKSNEVRLISATAQWRMGGSLFVGSNGVSSSLVVSNGALLEDFNGNLGFATASSNNSALITGPGSLWTNRGSFLVSGAFFSSSKSNRLVVSNSAALVAVGGSFVGGSGNQVIITGAGSRWANQSDFSFGGTASQLELSAGAALVTSNATITDLTSGDTDRILLTGSGTIWTNNRDLTMGYSARGVVTASNGASFFVGGRSIVGALSGSNSNTVWVTDPGTRCTFGSDLSVGSLSGGNLLAVSNGGFVASSNAFIGASTGASGNAALVSGAGSLWSNQAGLYVGAGDFVSGNQLVVSDGARLLSGNALIGASTNMANNNFALITGTGTVWSNRNDLTVGGFGIGNQLVVSNGATAHVGGIGVIGGGDFNAGSNLVLVSDPGTRWLVQSGLYVGNNSPLNRLVITNGGLVQSLFGEVGFSYDSRTNEVMVTGQGSMWDLGDGFLVLGAGSYGNRLVITNGGTVRCKSTSFGNISFQTASQALVTGPGSLWTNGDVLLIGDLGGANSLVVTNGGEVFTLNQTILGNYAQFGTNIVASTNNRIVVDGGILRTTNSLNTGMLNILGGTNVLNAGLIDVDQLLVTNGQGNFQFNGGTLITRGAQVTPVTSFEVGHGGPNPALWAVRAGPTNHYINGDLYVGRQTPFNQLLVTNGAFLTNTASAVIGFNAGANSNTVQLIGAGSRWLYGAYLEVGYSGSGNRFEVRDGAVCNGAGFEIGANPGANYNEMLVSGIGAAWSGSSDVGIGVNGDSNRLVVSDGGFVGDHEAIIGSDLGHNNSALVTGTGSIWTNAADLLIGYSSTGSQLIISNGGSVFVGTSGLIGSSPDTSNNAVVVTGPGSRWLIQQDLYVGSNSPLNRLTIANGALVTNRNASVGYWIPPILTVPTNSSDEVLVTGAGTLWNIGNLLEVGFNTGGNRLTISNGAVVKSLTTTTTPFFSTNNTIVVTGPGSAWTNQADLHVGNNTGGFDRLTISDSAVVDTGSAVIGDYASNCEASVSSPGSLWLNRSGLIIGWEGSASRLLVTNSGGVIVLSNAVLGGGSATNNRIIVVGSPGTELEFAL